MSDEHAATYVRPAWAAHTYRDETGTSIEYGRRWRGDPPEWAYTVTSNLDRFAPLHAVVDALVSYLDAEYQIAVSEARADVRALDTEPPAFDRVVRMSPEGARGRSMTIVCTSFPGVMIYLGNRYSEAFPACGCDACDDDLDDLVDGLETRVLTAARERLGWSRRS